MNDVISQESQPVPSEADRILAQDLLGDYGMGRGAVEKIAAHVAASIAQTKSEAAVYKRLFDGLVKLRPVESGTLDEWVDAMLVSATSTAVLREELREALDGTQALLKEAISLVGDGGDSWTCESFWASAKDLEKRLAVINHAFAQKEKP